MTVTWYPKNIVPGVTFIVAFLLVVKLAVNAERGLAIGLAAIVAHAIVNVMLSFNPAVWQRLGRTAPPQS